ncbi:MAG: DUF2892 domain-containing protein [Chromatiales bacterium]|nr:DUF2892 domain-containing protein [Chromatiales bacterium]
MSIERVVLAMGGFMVMLSVGLYAAYPVADLTEPNWLWLTGFVGLNLFQSAFTGFCPLASILKMMGKKTGPAFGS